MILKRIATYGVSLLLCICFTCLAFAQTGNLLGRAYKPSMSKAAIEDILKDIELQTKVPVSFSSATFNSKEVVKLKGTEQTIGDVLRTILPKEAEAVESTDKILIISRSSKKKGDRVFYTINGYLKDEKDKEVLIGAIVYEPSAGGVITNNYGFYSISLPEGQHTLICSYIGYKSDTISFNVTSDIRKDIFLNTHSHLSEVVVTKTRDAPSDHVQLSSEDIYSKPVLLGENDLMRALQHMSGVQSGMDGFNSIMVRGGDPGQNLSLLDGVPVYYVDHFFGLTSIFNTESIKTVDFYKGCFPARYGGRLSSIIDVNTKDGDMEKWGGQFTMGLIKGSLNIEGPLIKNKASIMVSGRRTWLDALWRPFTKSLRLNFYDLNAKANYIIDKKNRVYLSFYNGRDQIGATTENTFNLASRSGNTIGSAKWNRIVSPKLFVNTILTYSTFRYDLTQRSQVIDSTAENNVRVVDQKGFSVIKDAAIKMQANWYPSIDHKVEAGVKYAYSDFLPIALDNNIDPVFYPVNGLSNAFSSNEITLYVEDEKRLNDKWTIRPGLHWANWISKTYNYSSLQPRIYVSFMPNRANTIYASLTQMSQFLHSVSNASTGLQSDVWLPSTDKILPEEAMMGTIGYSYKRKADIDWNMEVYYKHIENATLFDPGSNLFDNTRNWDEKLLQGNGWSYGAELSFRKKLRSLYFSSAYTLSWTFRQFPTLNNGDAFPYRYDRRHNLKAALAYKRPKLAANAGWTYMTGEAITIPDQVYTTFDNNLPINANSNTSVYAYSYDKLNNYRLPAIHRLDVGFDFIKQKKKSERTWSLGVFNLYGNKNIILVELESIEPGKLQLKGRSFFLYIPYISYRLKF